MYALKVKWAVCLGQGNSTEENTYRQESRTFYIQKYPLVKTAVIQTKGWTLNSQCLLCKQVFFHH